jgi:hypothetical protein
MICSSCVLPSTTPGISFDDKGVCNYCHKSKSVEFAGEEALLEVINRFRGQGRYDCIVALSGGRDSSYVVLKAVRDYKLKVLAFNYRNPFTHPVASENIRRIQKRLGVDLVQLEFPRDIHRRTMRHNLIAWMRKPSLAMVPMMCVACKMLWKPILDIASRHNIKIAFSGSNPYEQTTFKRELLGIDAEASVARYYTGYIFGLVRESLSNVRYLAPEVLPTIIKGYMFSGPQAPMVRMMGKDLVKVSLFKYLPWDEKKVLTRIREEVGWESPPDNPCTWRFDCTVEEIKHYIYHKLMGVTEKDDFYSRLIRAGVMSRKEALKRIERENAVNVKAVEAVLAEVGISFRQLDQTLERYLESHSEK